jgi:hypothetical protein
MPVPITNEAVYIYSLPHGLLASLRPRKGHTLLAVEDSRLEHNPKDVIQDGIAASAGSSGRACNVCMDATFANVDEQREHFRSDWHRYNVKTRLHGGQSVGEARFAQLVEGPSLFPSFRDRVY